MRTNRPRSRGPGPEFPALTWLSSNVSSGLSQLRVSRTRLPAESNLRDLGISAATQRRDRRHRAHAFHVSSSRSTLHSKTPSIKELREP